MNTHSVIPIVPIDGLIARISDSRRCFMGIAMLSVFGYHLFCTTACRGSEIFRHGYIGVDVFLFLSSFGLCYSWERNDAVTFFKNRILRIFPLHFIERTLLFLACITLSGMGLKQTAIEWLFNVTTLAYYFGVGHQGAWFIPAILLLYALFPLLYRTVAMIKVGGVLFLAFLTLLYSHLFLIPWYYDCLISRIPIFLLGIAVYRSIKFGERFSAFDILFWFGIFVASVSISSTRFFRTAIFCPMFMMMVSPLMLLNRIRHALEFVGEHSFELFLGHEFGPLVIRNVIPLHGWLGAVYYVLSAGCGFTLFILFKRTINRYLVK